MKNAKVLANPIENTDMMALSYAREATLSKNFMLIARTGWERNDHEIKMLAYRNMLDFVIKQVSDLKIKENILEIIKYLDARSDSEVKANMHRANEIIRNV